MKSLRPRTHTASCITFACTFACAVACTAMMAAPASAQVSIGVGISLPTPIVFVAPPQVVVLPGYDIYVAPDISEEIYFVDGFWWRPWQGRWYRSTSYDSGWGYYDQVPYFYSNVRLGWRDDYHNHRWEGQDWNYERVSHQRVEQNWSSWKSNKYWEKEKSWGVPNRKGGGHSQNERAQGSQPQQRSPQMQSSPTPQRSSQPKAVQQQRSSQPKAAPQQHRSAQPKASPQQRNSVQQPKGASSKHGGGGPDQGQKQHSQQPGGGGGGKSQDHGQGGDKGQGQPGGQGGAQHGGGKGKQ